MKRQYVQSSNIRSIGYDASAMILEVEFHDRRVYQYFDVPESRHQGIMQASSHGKYLNNYIKGYYQYKQ
ncbi:unnamed protein product, partial [marine sediment metagenome]